MRLSKYNTAIVIGFVAFVYYLALCAKQYTWAFVSFDSSDWLASSLIWLTPQAYGSPLYIVLGHLLNLIPIGSLALRMTVALSVIPSAVTISFTYLIIRQFGLSNKLGIIGSLILLGCGVFLSQSTVLEEYALATMFVAVAYYLYLNDKRTLTAISLGLGIAVHIIVLPIAALWLVIEYRQWKLWVKPSLALIAFGLLPYLLTLYLMWIDTPKWIAGYLSLPSLNVYLRNTDTIGQLSLIETPKRLYQVASIMLLGFGVNIVPLFYGLKKPLSNAKKIMVSTIAFCLWLYVTNTDMSTWTFTMFAIPFVSVAIAIGLSNLPKYAMQLGITCAVLLIVANAFLLNADALSKNNEAKYYYQAMQDLDDGAIVATFNSGAYGVGLFYAIAEGKDLIPIIVGQEPSSPFYLDYLRYASKHYGLEGGSWIEQVNFSLQSGKRVYVAWDIYEIGYLSGLQYGVSKYNDYFYEIV